MPILAISIQHYTERSSQGHPVRGEKKKEQSTQIRKKEVKLSLFPDDTILYIENHNEFTLTQLDLNILSIVCGI